MQFFIESHRRNKMLDCVFNHPACLSWGPSLSGPCFVFVSGQMPGVCACASKNQSLMLCISEATSGMGCWKDFWATSATWWKCCCPIPSQCDCRRPGLPQWNGIFFFTTLSLPKQPRDKILQEYRKHQLGSAILAAWLRPICHENSTRIGL